VGLFSVALIFIRAVDRLGMLNWLMEMFSSETSL
jgi:hypothetical protein